MRSNWTHSICGECWEERSPGRKPFRIINDDDNVCCFCGAITLEGIYVRLDPSVVPCGGSHDEEP